MLVVILFKELFQPLLCVLGNITRNQMALVPTPKASTLRVLDKDRH